MVLPAQTVSFSYDGLGRVNARTHVDGINGIYIEKHGFHGDGSQAWLELNLPDNKFARERVDYAYDSAGRMRWMWSSDGTNTQQLFQATKIDPFGRLRGAIVGKNIEYAANHEEVGRRLPIDIKVSSDVEARHVQFTGFDPVGRELSRNEDSPFFTGKQTSAYDALGRLHTSQRVQGASTPASWTFNYDPLGNLVDLNDNIGTASAFLSYQTTDRDRICNINFAPASGIGCNVAYDSVGNIIHEPTRTGYNKLSYLNAGNVRTIENQAGAKATFRYDPFGAVQSLDISAGADLVRSDQRFGAFISQRYQSGPVTEAKYISRQFPGPGLTITRRGPQGPWIYQFSDSRGTRFTTDQEGRFVQDVDYTPFGEAAIKGAAPGTAEFSTEQWNDGDALEQFGLVHLGARLYDPVIGRFLSRDPLLIPRTSATSNPYAFAFNDPINFSDPTGLDACAENVSCGGPNLLTTAASLGVLAANVFARSGAHVPVHVSSDNQQRAFNIAFSVQYSALTGAEDPWDTSDCNARCRNIRRMARTWPDDLPSSRSVILDGSESTRARAGANGAAAIVGLALVVPPLAKGLALYAMSQAKTEGEALGAAVGAYLTGVIGPLRGASTIMIAAPTRAGAGDILAAYGAMVPARSDGYYNVVIHGTERALWIYRNGKPVEVSVKQFASFVRQNVPAGQPVRLIGCDTGACANGPAQQLANELGVPVQAPTGKSYIDISGEFGLVDPSASAWSVFAPLL
jgi:RHS repeat-associated protein